MKKLLLLIGFAGLLNILGNTQEKCEWQNPLPADNRLNSVYIIDVNTAFTVGSAGIVLKTTNGGINWENQNSGISKDLNSVFFIDANNGFAVGNEVSIKTTNGGINWTQMDLNYSVFHSVFFTDANTGYVCGGGLNKTTDSGINWFYVSTGTTNTLNSVCFPNINIGYIAGEYGQIRKTTDSGLNWTEQTTGISSELKSIYFIDANIGFAVGANGCFLKTTNGGTNWLNIIINNNITYLNSICFINANIGYAVGYSDQGSYPGAILLKTTNGGTNWDLQRIPNNNLNSVQLINDNGENIGYAVGGSTPSYNPLYSNSNETILKTNNSGTNWISQNSGITYLLRSVFFTDSNIGFAVGGSDAEYMSSLCSNIILKTTNSGLNWKPLVSNSMASFESIYFCDAQNGYAVGSNGAIIKTTDQGINWVNQISGTTNTLYSVFFVNDSIGFAAGTSGTILKTTNGGINWVTQTSGTTKKLYSICFTNLNNGFAVGENGVMRKTVNGGLNWTNQAFGACDLNSLYFTDANTGFAAGSDQFGNLSIIIKTTNGGQTWNSLYSNTKCRSIFFVNSSIGYTVGLNGEASKTTDGGANWVNSDYHCGNLSSVFFTNVNTGYAVGEGCIIKTTDGGINWGNSTGEPTNNLVSVFFIDSDNGFAVGEDYILKTTNSGTNWLLTESYYLNNGYLYGNHSIFFTDINTGYLVGGGTNNTNSVIRKTTNGGISWINQPIELTGFFNSIYFSDSNTGYIVGGGYGKGKIIKTTNAGANWITQISNFTQGFNSVFFVDNNTGYAVGNYGTIQKTTNGGTNWIAQTNGINYSSSYNSVYFIDLNIGFIVGEDQGYGGEILKTTNGGTNWVEQPYFTSSILYSIYMSNSNIALAAGSNGAIIKTTNGGANWYNINSGTNNILRSINIADDNSVYIVGQNGTILKTELYCVAKSATPTGPTVLCQPINNQYITSGAANAASYIWSIAPSTAGTISGTGLTASVNWNATFSGLASIKVKGCNTCGEGPFSDPLFVNVEIPPFNADTISGYNSVCQGQNNVTYTVDSILNATSYIWTIPNGATGTSNSNTITVNYSTSAVSGDITAKGHNSCGDGNTSIKSITVNVKPDSAGTITGITTVCQGQSSVIYSVPLISNATSYIWTLPTGATGISSTNSITVDYGTSAISGNITVKGNNLCGDGGISTLAIIVNPLPNDAGTISGNTAVCLGQNNVTYTVPAITNAISYIWTLPTGATGTSTTNSITVNYGINAVSGDISVKGHNSCGDGVATNLAVTVNPIPSAPIITQNLSTLTSNAPSGNQWYLNGSIIIGATSQSHTCLENGDYYDIVTLNGCSSDISNIINIPNAGIEFIENNKIFKIYPNPVNDELIIEISGTKEDTDFEILNSIGQIVFKGKLLEKTVVNTTTFSPGVYLIKFENGKTFEFKKMVKE